MKQFINLTILIKVDTKLLLLSINMDSLSLIRETNNLFSWTMECVGFLQL